MKFCYWKPNVVYESLLRFNQKSIFHFINFYALLFFFVIKPMLTIYLKWFFSILLNFKWIEKWILKKTFKQETIYWKNFFGFIGISSIFVKWFSNENDKLVQKYLSVEFSVILYGNLSQYLVKIWSDRDLNIFEAIFRI